jgi:hypothetical protein
MENKIEVINYQYYNRSESGRTDDQKLEVVKIAETNEKSCLKCAHFTRVSQIDNGKCHVHYNRHDVHDVCPRFETPEQWAKRLFGK